VGHSALKYKNRNTPEYPGKEAQIVQDSGSFSHYHVHTLNTTMKDENEQSK
jgi:hypothetical protein